MHLSEKEGERARLLRLDGFLWRPLDGDGGRQLAARLDRQHIHGNQDLKTQRTTPENTSINAIQATRSWESRSENTTHNACKHINKCNTGNTFMGIKI
jgi:hypothetical protein